MVQTAERGKRMTKTIKTVVRCPDDMVMVFDKDGEQIPEYQGQYEAVKDKILRDAPPNAIFTQYRDYEPELQKIPRKEW